MPTKYFDGENRALYIFLEGVEDTPVSLLDLGFRAHLADAWPEVKRDSIDIPGGNGALDLSEVTGGVTYGNRAMELQVHTIPDRNSAEEDISAFMMKYSGKRVRLRVRDVTEHTNLYEYSGRLSPIDDDGGKRLRNVTFAYDAEPFRFKTFDTVYGIYAQDAYVDYYDFDDDDVVSGTCLVSAHQRDENVKIWYPMQTGEVTIYSKAVVEGTWYAAEIVTEHNRASVEITDTEGNAYDPAGFEATENEVHIKVTFGPKTMGCSAKVGFMELAMVSHENKGLPVQMYYSTIAESGATSIILNGKRIPLRYTGWEKTATDPELLIKTGMNRIAVINDGEGDPGQRTFISWREAMM